MGMALWIRWVISPSSPLILSRREKLSLEARCKGLTMESIMSASVSIGSSYTLRKDQRGDRRPFNRLVRVSLWYVRDYLFPWSFEESPGWGPVSSCTPFDNAYT